MNLAAFKASELPEERKQEIVKQIEKAMSKYCSNCTTSTVDNSADTCEKHLSMYHTLFPSSI